MRSRSRRAAARAALAVCLALLLAGIASAPASATDYYWNCGVLDPNWWCPSPEIHTYGYAKARENYNRSMNLCVKLTKPYDSSYYYARKCEWGPYTQVYSLGGGRAPYPNNSVDMRAHVANGANANPYIIMGYATY